MASTRRLAAILAADVAGYSRLMGSDEEGTHERLRAHLSGLIYPKIEEHRGRVVKNTGDGFLAEFASVVDGVRCAVEIQWAMDDREPGIPDDRRIRFRIGINLGDVIVEGDDIYGDGVNVAARLEALAEPGGICVSRVVRDQIRDKLDLAFDDMGEQQVKNIARPVRAFRIPIGKSAAPPTMGSLEPAALPLPDKPSIAVLPFQNRSDDPEQEYFADGMVEEIITALSRIRWLFVIARNSTFTYKGQAIDVKRVGRELGVRYVLEGSVRKAGQRLRITAQLIDALTGTHLWADRFEGSLEDVFDLQDKVASSVAGVIEPALQAAETERSAGRPTTDLTAYDAYLRADAIVASSARQVPEALQLLEQAITRDPNYGTALAEAAICCMRLCVDGTSTDREADSRKGAEYARRALRAAGDDPGVLANAAHALAHFGEDLDAMTALADRALSINPNYARGWYVSGQIRRWAGDLDVAITHFEAALRLSPTGRVGPALEYIGVALFLSRRFEEALPKLLQSIQADTGRTVPYRYLIACYAHLGRIDEARATLARLRALTQKVMPSVAHWRNADHRELLLSGMRLATGETS
jgi:TolB-like protein/class 3 adenylate cyclase